MQWCKDQIPIELIRGGGEILYSEIHKLINSLWNSEEFYKQWKESIIVHIYMCGNKADLSNYRRISLLPNLYKILPIIVSSSP
jgi:hypothetical protein